MALGILVARTGVSANGGGRGQIYHLHTYSAIDVDDRLCSNLI